MLGKPKLGVVGLQIVRLICPTIRRRCGRIRRATRKRANSAKYSCCLRRLSPSSFSSEPRLFLVVCGNRAHSPRFCFCQCRCTHSSPAPQTIHASPQCAPFAQARTHHCYHQILRANSQHFFDDEYFLHVLSAEICFSEETDT